MFELIDGHFLSVILFFLIIGILIYKDRKKVEFHFLVVMRRTKHFRKLIDKIANISPQFWKAIATLGIFACFYVMFYGTYLLLITAHSIFIGIITKPALQLILPTPMATGATGPGYILIPFWFWLITIASILVPHEMMHGIVARAEKIRLKSVGLLLLVMFPGAFVEPDEKQLQRARLLTRLRIFAAGSFANFSVALIILALLGYLVWPAVAGTGIILEKVAENSPAQLAGLQPGQTITSINGKPITTSYWEYLSARGYFTEEIGQVSVGDKLTFIADGKEYSVTVAEEPGTGAAYVGIIYKPIMKVPLFEFFTLVNLLTMIWLFSLAVGMINILPIYPLDGGLMFEALAKKYFKASTAKRLTRAVTLFLIFILFFDFAGPWIIGG